MEKRLTWIDVARGIGIILVVLGHCFTTVVRKDNMIAGYMYNAIYYFHMPFMFFVSGIAFNISIDRYKTADSAGYFIKKLKKLIVPYICYSLIVYIVFSIANTSPWMNCILDRAGYGKITFIEWIKGLLSGENLYCQHLWYIYSLFILSILSFALLKLVGNKYKYILFLITFICWYYFTNPVYYDVVWKTSMRGMWFAVGTFLPIEFLSNKKNRVYVMCSFPCVLFFKWYIMSLDVGYRIGRLLDLIIIFGIILMVLIISYYIDLNGGKRLSCLGKLTFPIYMFHQPLFGSGLGVILYGTLHLNIILCIVISFISCIVFPLIFDKILRHKRLKLLRKMLLG